MEVFQNLKILLPENNKTVFFEKLIQLIEKSNWIIKHDLMNNYKKNSFSINSNILCIESEKYNYHNREIQGLLWFGESSGYYEVLNIVPTNSRHLNTEEYNFILLTFYKSFIEPLSIDFDAKVEISKPQKLIFETIGEDALKALLSFSKSANKSTGNTNPYDFERWCNFIFIIFRRNIELSSLELENWLIENGWDDEMASKLSLEYEYSISLLEKYEYYQ